MPQNRKARKSNVEAHGSKFAATATVGDYKSLNKQLPKRMTDMKRCIAHVCSEMEKPGDPTSVSVFHLETLRKIRDIAFRENIQRLESIICPNCKEEYQPTCTHCHREHKIEILDTSMEKISVQCLNILANKLFPNMAPITNDVNILDLLNFVNGFVGKLIARFDPEEQRTFEQEWESGVREHFEQ